MDAHYSLDYLTIDLYVYDKNQAAFDSWDAIEGNVLTVVPEPSSMLLLCLGAFALLGFGRSRRK